MKNKIILISLISFAVLFTGLWNYSQAAGNGVEVCVRKNGAIFMIGDGFKRADCLKNEKLISWNITGPQGPKGDKGDQGPIGLTGPQGPRGNSNDSKIQELEARIAVLEEMHKVPPPEPVTEGTLAVSLNSSTPKKNDIVANQGSANNQFDMLPILTFNLQAKNDDIQVADAALCVTKTGVGTAIASPTFYLFDGSTEIGTGDVNASGCATFSDINYTIPKDTTKVLTLKVDIRSANVINAFFVGHISSTGITAENSAGDPVTDKSGSATGNTIGIRNIGPEITLISKSVTTNGVPQTANSTSTITANFNVKVKAVGGDIILGKANSAMPMFGTDSFKLYPDGTIITIVNEGISSLSFSVPSSCVIISGTNNCTLAEGNEVTIPVTYQVQGRNAFGSSIIPNLYSIGLEKIKWNDQTSTFMAGETGWRTTSVNFP